MRKELEKVYDPGRVEDNTYRYWEEGGCFSVKPDPTKEPYTIVIPPPNITGQLHMGHALDNTLQDILIRFKRMQGYAALWIPGTDHASIATEAKIVAAMKEEGISKEDIGRDGFLERAWEWKRVYGGRIINQLKKLGTSCDWSRERFTLDEGCSSAVREVFVRLYEKGLIYRGERMINWCPACRTSLSDIEVEFEEQQGHFWHLRYPMADGSGELLLATTRPETLLGDTAVAVHPEDERYQKFIGKNVILPLVGREIPVVADEYVERDFGTGVVKITPAHDPNDFEVGLRHDLPIINVMNDDATINGQGGKYAGLTREEARKRIVADLEAEGFLVKVEPHTHNVGTCQRCHTTVEPRLSKQWFVKMEPLAKPALEAVQKGETRFIPERFDKIYYNWMENIKDWCISRQLWWGHRIPAFYCDACGTTVISKDDPDTCPNCHAPLRQDEDTLDTWFSSALWPFSTLGWPEDTEDLKYFYPTTTLVTGYDIIFFWVARMIFSALEHTGEVPFKNVLMHGLVRDAQGRKMSKSLGNGIDPLEVIAEYGADALRMMLATGNSPGNDMRYSEDRVKACRNFANKLWNASRFILMNLPEDMDTVTLPETLSLEDRWILSRCNDLIREVTDNLERFELGTALSKIYDFIWDIYCDWYIELAKPRIQAGGETASAAQNVLVYVMRNMLKLLHPFMPFITEEIWQTLPGTDGSIMVSAWPEYVEAHSFPAEVEDMERIIAAIRGVRNLRAEMGVPYSKKTKLYIETAQPEVYENGALFFERLASSSSLETAPHYELEGVVTVVTDTARIFIPMLELIDREKELARLDKERTLAEKEIAIVQGKLGNEAFVQKAPTKLVEGEKEKLSRAEERLKKVLESIASLS